MFRQRTSQFSNMLSNQVVKNEIIKLFTKLKIKGQLLSFTYRSVPFMSVALHLSKFSRILRKDLKYKRYKLNHAKLSLITDANHKNRIVYNFNYRDKLVIASITNILHDISADFLSPKLYSYRKESSTWSAARNVSHFILPLREKRQDVFILKTDIASYTDEINVTNSSYVWDLLQRLFEDNNIKLDQYEFDLVRSIVRPSFYNLNGVLQSNITGIPTGSAITSFLYNLCLHDIDVYFSGLDNISYSRYSDDLLFISNDVYAISSAEKKLDAMLNAINLRRKKEKDMAIILREGSLGCLNDDKWKNQNYFEYLGYRFNHNGKYSLSKRRQRRILRNITNSIINYSDNNNICSEEKLHEISSLLRVLYLDRDSRILEVKTLLETTNDINALKHIDTMVAQCIISQVTGIKGVRSLRKISYQELHREYKLPSLTNLYEKLNND